MTRALLIFGLFLAACNDDPAPSTDDTDTTPTDDTDTTPALDGEQLFADTCAVCHNTDGTGTGAGPDITRELGKSDAALINIIRNGTGRMPGQSVTQEEAQAIVDWMKANL